MPLQPADQRRGDDRDNTPDRHQLDDRRGNPDDPDKPNKKDEDPDQEPGREAEVAQPRRRLGHPRGVARLKPDPVISRDGSVWTRGHPPAKQPHRSLRLATAPATGGRAATNGEPSS
jgi:hypothetical protein